MAQQTVIGIFDSSSEAQSAVDQLVSNGFSRSNIDISARSEDYNRTTDSYNRTDRDDDSFGDKVSNFFSSLFDTDDDVNRYSSVARRGSVVTVHTMDRQESQRAADIMDRYGAVDVDERAMQYRSNLTGSDTLNRATTTDDSASLPVIEEELQVGKREVQTGGVRLRSRIIERPVEEMLRLRVEHVHVERNPVNRPASEADLNNFQEGTIEVTERAEVPVVNKEARVVEEVRLEKDVEEREETVRDTVRRTDVDVENIRSDERRTDDYRTDRLDTDEDLNRPGSL